MLKMKIKQLEAILGTKIKRNTKILGIDLATKTGYCIATSNSLLVMWGQNIRLPILPRPMRISGTMR